MVCPVWLTLVLGRRAGLLVTHFSIISSMGAWISLIEFRGVRLFIRIINFFLSEL